MDKTLGVGLVGGLEGGLALGLHLGRLAGMHHTRREQAEAGVMMLIVVPGKKRVGPSTRVGQAAEEGRKRWMVLKGFELGLRKRVVIRDMRPGVAVADT